MSTKIKDEPMAYIARKACGCIVMACVDVPLPEVRKDNAKEISKAIRDGLTIERVTCEYVRQNMKGCSH